MKWYDKNSLPNVNISFDIVTGIRKKYEMEDERQKLTVLLLITTALTNN